MKTYIEDKHAGKLIASGRAAQEVVHDQLADLDHEEVWVIHLTSAHTVIAAEMVSMGTLSETAVDCKRILRAALLQNARAIIVTHNHPSGNPEPGKEDLAWTIQLRRACDIMNIDLLDHVILSKDRFFSFSQNKSLKY